MSQSSDAGKMEREKSLASKNNSSDNFLKG
jgi:hypothetical protein